MKFYAENKSYNGKYYGDQNDFTKKSWRKFVKIQAFL